MGSLASFVKLRSLPMWPAVLGLALILPLAQSACIIVEDHDEHEGWAGGKAPPDDPVEPLAVAIDADAVLSAKPGDGVGLFVEYAAGGRWRIWTTCDTTTSGVSCNFEAAVSVDIKSEILSVTGEDLEAGDDEAYSIDS